MNIDGLLRMPSVMLFLTLAVYALAVQIRARTGNVLCNPVLISTLVLMGYLKVFAIDYVAVFTTAAQFIDFWLKPAVVLLAVPALSKLGPYPQPVVAGGVVAVGGQRNRHCYGRVFCQMAGRFARSDSVAGFQIRDQPDCD